MAIKQLAPGITVDPKVMAGKPVVRGTRIPVQRVLAYLAETPDFDQFFADYPELTLADLQACLAYASARLSRQSSVTSVPRTGHAQTT